MSSSAMLPETLIDRLRYVEIFTTRTVRNHRTGDNLSRIRGRSFEFDEHKPYQAGDDVRQIDWKVTARMQTPYVKRELEEKELSVMILVDVSASMLCTSAPQSKRDLALEAAAVLAFSAAADHINAGLIAFSDRVECFMPPKRGQGQAWKLIESLWGLRPEGRRTSFTEALETLNSALNHAALVFCLSDFVDGATFWDSRCLTGILHRVDFVPVVIRDQWEENLPATSGYLRVRDPETGRDRVISLSAGKQSQYRCFLNERNEQIRKRFYHLGLDHVVLRTDGDSLGEMMAFLMKRKRRSL